jgi:hypothetical protein
MHAYVLAHHLLASCLALRPTDQSCCCVVRSHESAQQQSTGSVFSHAHIMLRYVNSSAPKNDGEQHGIDALRGHDATAVNASALTTECM